jgi:hypothetical protein
MTMATSASCPLQPRTNCSYSSPSGSRYDLSALFNGPGLPDYTNSDALYTYTSNICGPSSVATCGAGDGIMCQYLQSSGNLVAVLARVKASPAPVWSMIDSSSPKDGVRVTFTNGILSSYIVVDVASQLTIIILF